jgi:isopentenyl phosphate kinase
MYPPCQWAGGKTTMLITSITPFHFVHDAKEEFDLGEKPVNVSEEAYNHLVAIHGYGSFGVLDEEAMAKESDKPKKKK